MPHFEYEAKDAQGETSRGMLNATSAEEAQEQLEQRGLKVVAMQPVDLQQDSGHSADPNTLTPLDRTLERLDESSQTLGPALEAYAKELPWGAARRSLLKVAYDIKARQVADSLTDASLPHRDLLWTVIAGQAAGDDGRGFLRSVLTAARNYARRRNRLWRAFVYPVFLLLFCVFVASFVLLFVMPQFRSLFLEFEVALPAPTMLLLAIGGQHFFKAVLLMLAAVVVTMFLIPRRIYDYLLEWVPIVGRYRRCCMLARFCRTSSALIRAGAEVPVAVEQAGQNPTQPLLTRATEFLAGDLRETQPVPVVIYPMVATVAYAFFAELNPTERSNVLWELAELYDDLADRLLKWLELTYEPLLVLFLGCFIGFTIIALLLPLVSLISNLS